MLVPTEVSAKCLSGYCRDRPTAIFARATDDAVLSVPLKVVMSTDDSFAAQVTLIQISRPDSHKPKLSGLFYAWKRLIHVVF